MVDNKLGSNIVVLKIGTSSIIHSEYGTLNMTSLCRVCEVALKLTRKGYKVVLVSSGSVGVGRQHLNKGKPQTLAQKQAYAAVGQGRLMEHYSSIFSSLGLRCAQVLLTLQNLTARAQYLNVRNTFQELLAMEDVIPVVNENDTVAVSELQFGDNDTLAAQVGALLTAKWVFLLTDVDALYTANPLRDPNARRIPVVQNMEDLDADTGGTGSQWGTGGMATKITAAYLATAAGCTMVVQSSADTNGIVDTVENRQSVGTVFLPVEQPVKGRKRWILALPSKGKLIIDDGASQAIINKKSLFSAGVVKVTGKFEQYESVTLVDLQGRELARALATYSSEDMRKLVGKQSNQVENILGFSVLDEVVHRDNISLFAAWSSEAKSSSEGSASPRQETPTAQPALQPALA